jgi:hypothetical protein
VKLQVTGVTEAMNAYKDLPRRVAMKHLRIALNAAGGVMRDAAKARARKQTGLLKQSLAVKVKIPAASYNAAHHNKPAYAVIGAKRNFSRQVMVNKRGAVRSVTAKRAEKLKASGVRLTTRRPSRYAHLVERVDSFINASARQSQSAAVEKMKAKLSAGISQEAAALVKG